MCLAIPAEIIKIEGNMAKGDFGQGVVRDVNVMLVNAQVGKYVLVHAGYAIQVIEPKEAKETLRLWDEILTKSELTDLNR